MVSDPADSSPGGREPGASPPPSGSDSPRPPAPGILSASADHYRVIFDAVNDAIAIHDAEDGTILDVNRSAEELFGYPREELLGMKSGGLSSGVPPYSVEDARARMQAARSGSPQLFEWRSRRKDGTVFPSEVSLRRTVIDGRECLVGVVRDVSERHAAESAVVQSQERLRQIVEGSPVPTFVIDRDHRVTHWNRACVELTGLGAADVLATRDHYRAFYDHERPTMADALVDGLSAEAIDELYDGRSRASELVPGAYEAEGFFPDFGEDGRWLFFTATPLRDGGEEVLGAIETLQDITERKRAEEALRERERFLENIFQAIQDGISVLDTDLTIVRTNRWMQKMYAHRAPLEGRKCYTVYQNRETPCDFCPSLEVIETGETRTTEVPYPDADNPRGWIELTAYPLADEGGKVTGVIEYVKDITARKEAEEARERLEAQLRQAQKLEAVGRLAGGVAHDFNNKLQGILGFAEMMLTDGNLPGELMEPTREILKGAQQSADLTRQLLAFARKQTIAPEVLDMNEVVQGTLGMLRRLMGEDVELVWNPAPDLWSVKMDPSQIDQILANLCVNARDAIEGVGRVVIETQNARFDEEYCGDHSGFQPGAYVCLAVSDDGCGMDKETVGHVFEPFFTTKNPEKGTGLGLSTVYGIVKQNEGFINVYSEPGHGTIFRIYHPALEEAPAEERPGKGFGTEARGKETVLLVEDEESVRRVTRRFLESLGYEVLSAASPGRAMELARSHADDIDLLITDVILPEMNGRELAHRLLSANPYMKDLYISGYTADVIADHGVLEEGVRFLQKPFSRKELAARVREVLDGG